jgi:hypothetical protein
VSTASGTPGSGPGESLSRAVISHFRTLSTPLYAILDSGHAHRRITSLLDKSGCEHCSLYGKRLYDFTDGRGPYLIALPPQTDFLELLIDSAWGKSWGIYLTAAVAFRPLQRHLARKVSVTIDRGRTGLFRFYDPRVLNDYLPGCSARQLEDFFGSISSFYLESYDAHELIRLSLLPACGNAEATYLSRSAPLTSLNSRTPPRRSRRNRPSP